MGVVGEAGTWLQGCNVRDFDRAVRVGGLEGRKVDGSFLGGEREPQDAEFTGPRHVDAHVFCGMGYFFGAGGSALIHARLNT